LQRNRKMGGWILFVATLLLLSLGASPYHKIADTALIALRLSLVLVLSILVVCERWNHRRDLPGERGQPENVGEGVLQRCGTGIMTRLAAATALHLATADATYRSCSWRLAIP